MSPTSYQTAPPRGAARIIAPGEVSSRALFGFGEGISITIRIDLREEGVDLVEDGGSVG